MRKDVRSVFTVVIINVEGYPPAGGGKSAPIFWGLGDLDELSVTLGFVRVFASSKSLKRQILTFQDDLIAIGGFLSGVKKGIFLAEKIAGLEAKIDKLKNPLVKEFSRPGITKTSTFLHLARAVCRRVERGVVGLGEKRYQPLASYLNRLSSVLFWLAKKEEGL
jgi:cob(I)alamin adenosyltransferase